MVRGEAQLCVTADRELYINRAGERKDACGWNSFLSPLTLYIM